MKRRFQRIGSLFLLLVLRLVVPEAFASRLAPGIEYEVFRVDGPNVVHVIAWDRTVREYTLELGFAEGRRGFENRETVSRIVERHLGNEDRVVAAINGSFFGSGIEIVGALASGGRLIQVSNATRALMAVFTSGEFFLTENVYHSGGTLRFPDGETLPIHFLNQYRQINSMVAYTPDWGESTQTTAPGVEVILENVSYPMRTGTWVEGTVSEIRTGDDGINSRIPKEARGRDFRTPLLTKEGRGEVSSSTPSGSPLVRGRDEAETPSGSPFARGRDFRTPLLTKEGRGEVSSSTPSGSPFVRGRGEAETPSGSPFVRGRDETETPSGSPFVRGRAGEGGMVLSAREEAGERLLAKVRVGQRLQVRFTATEPLFNNADFIIGGAGMLLSGGEIPPVNWERYSDRFAGSRHPRTVIAWNEEKVFLIACDGRQPGYSAGMTFEEMAGFLRNRLRATDALNLDGGGSTTLWGDGRILNSPSTEALGPGTGRERPVANAVLLVKRPRGPGLPVSDPFIEEGRLSGWDDKFTPAEVVPFDPPAPEGDGWVLRVRDPSGGFDTTRWSTPSRNQAVEADLYLDYRPDLAENGFERVGIFARDNGHGNFDTARYGGGECYLLAFDSDTGRLRAGTVTEGRFEDWSEGNPHTIQESRWARFRIECRDDRIRFLVNGKVIAERRDTTHAFGYGGIGHHESFRDNRHVRGSLADHFRIIPLEAEP